MLEWWNGGTVERWNGGYAEQRNGGKSTKTLKRGKAEIRSIALKAGGQKKNCKER